MLLGQRTAGDPDDAAILYTDLSPNRLSQELNDLGTPVSAEPIRQWMDEHKLRLRQMSKVLTGERQTTGTPNSKISPTGSSNIKRRAIPTFPSIPRPKSFSVSSIAREESALPRRLRRLTMIFPA